MINKKTNLIIGGLLVALGIVLGILGTTFTQNYLGHETNQSSTTPTTTTKQSVEDYLNQLIESSSYFYQDKQTLQDGALTGMVNSLGDPHSEYMSPEDFQNFENQLNQSIYGVGISITLNGSYPLIVQVLTGSPADDAGLEVGQTIVSIDGTDIKDQSLANIVNLIKGTKATIRTFGVYTSNPNNVSEINVSIDELTTSTIDYNFNIVDSKRIGYLKIDSFMYPTYNEFKAEIEHLESLNMDDLIVDVRDNPGGLVTSVTSILDYFINTDEPFIYSETKDGTRTPYYLNQNDHTINYNIVILVNENSASAAEIFASAMNEIGGYPLIGTTTYGKGTMQNTYYLDDSHTSAVKLTTNIWLTANQEWIDKKGIDPTISVEQSNFINLNYINASDDISYDKVNQGVKDVQIFLNRMGYLNRTDGYFDKATEDAIKNYQTTHDLTATGVVNYQTAYKMNLDIMDYIHDKKNDNQYQSALNYILS